MLETHRDARHIDMDGRIWISNQWNKWDMPYSWDRPRAPSLPWSGRDINGAGVDVAGDKRRGLTEAKGAQPSSVVPPAQPGMVCRLVS